MSSTCSTPWSPPVSAFAGFRFPSDVIVVAVRWYLRYNLSYRDVEELLVERGVEVDHVTGMGLRGGRCVDLGRLLDVELTCSEDVPTGFAR